MKLGKIYVKNVEFDERARIENHNLYINEEEIKKLVLEDERIAKIDVRLAKPGEKKRIIPVKDVIEPRVKVEGPGGIFPGIVGPSMSVGSGITQVLKNVAVVTVGRIVGFQEGMIDMSGPGAKYSPFSETLNIALVMDPKEGIEKHAHEEAVRIAGHKVAAKMGELAKNVKPDEVETFEVEPIPASGTALSRIVYVPQVLAQGLLHDTYVYGVDCKGMLPVLLNPLEMMDGAIVSGNCVSGCDKNTTYHYLNDPVVEELLRKHGKDLYFAGVVVTPCKVRLAEKEKCADYAVKLCSMLHADGLVLTEEGFGNPEIDMMMICRKAKALGIESVLIGDEYAGPDGLSQGIADTTPEADAFVSVGNANEIIEVPEMEEVIGDDKTLEILAGGRKKLNGNLLTEIQVFTGSTNALGYGKLRCYEY